MKIPFTNYDIVRHHPGAWTREAAAAEYSRPLSPIKRLAVHILPLELKTRYPRQQGLLQQWRSQAANEAYRAALAAWASKGGFDEKRAEAVDRIQKWLKSNEPGNRLDLSGLKLTSLPELPATVQRLNLVSNQLTDLPPPPAALKSLYVDSSLYFVPVSYEEQGVNVFHA